MQVSARLSVLAVFTVLSVLSAGSVAAAQDVSPAVSPAVPPLRIGLGIGPAVGFNGGAQLLIGEEIDYTLVTADIGRFYLGGALAQQVGGYFQFEIGVRAGFDFDIYESPDVIVMAGPSLILGAAIAEGFNAPIGSFHGQIAGEARVLFANGLVGVWLRPLAFDIFAGEYGAGGRWNLLAGASVQL